MTEPRRSTAWAGHIPVLWLTPAEPQPHARLAIWLNGLSGTKEQVEPHLRDLAAAGFIALSFDAWQHGERGDEEPKDLAARVFSNFRRAMWPILGQTTLDTLRVIDWATRELGVAPQVYVGGTSMGGDVAVAAAGIDQRIERVAAIVATPDWRRPGMQDLFQPGVVLEQGEADTYAQYFYDQLNPITHIDRYARGPQIAFVCAAEDTHVPPDGALRFQAALRECHPAAAARTRVELIPERGHMDGRDPMFWQRCMEWLTQGVHG